MKPAKSAPVHRREATVKATKSTAVETPAPASVEPPAAAPVPAAAPAAAVPRVGEIRLAERGSAQQSSCGCQNLCRPWPSPMFA
jgi:hypothetical protein